MLDIDDFKSINDTYGHQIGDMVIKYVAEEIKLNVRKTDLVGRYGGDEFVIILFQCPSAQAKMIAEKINARVQETHCPDGINEVKVNLSMGVYSASEGENGETALSKVDKALYCSKSRGKNQVTSYEELYGEFRE